MKPQVKHHATNLKRYKPEEPVGEGRDAPPVNAGCAGEAAEEPGGQVTI